MIWRHPLLPDGQEPARTALEALALEAYRQRRITGYQLRTLIGIPSRSELDGFLKQHEVCWRNGRSPPWWRRNSKLTRQDGYFRMAGDRLAYFSLNSSPVRLHATQAARQCSLLSHDNN